MSLCLGGENLTTGSASAKKTLGVESLKVRFGVEVGMEIEFHFLVRPQIADSECISSSRNGNAIVTFFMES